MFHSGPVNRDGPRLISAGAPFLHDAALPVRGQSMLR